MPSIYTLTIGFFLIFSIIGLFACALFFDRALDGLVLKFKSQDQAKTKQNQSAKNWLAAISFIRNIRPIYKAKFFLKIVIALVTKIISAVKFMFGLVSKIIGLRANAKRNLEARIQNQHALQHAYSKF